MCYLSKTCQSVSDIGEPGGRELILSASSCCWFGFSFKQQLSKAGCVSIAISPAVRPELIAIAVGNLGESGKWGGSKKFLEVIVWENTGTGGTVTETA